MPAVFRAPLHLRCPGLFITATDTGVGKTLAACAIAWALRRERPGCRVGVCKPLASGCRREREGLVSDDAEALAHFADCRQPLDVINPVRYGPPVAPAVAAELTGQAADFDAIARSLRVLDECSDYLLVEGVGGLLAPIDAALPRRSVLDLVAAVGLPVLIVTRPTLGTLNHTAMTARLLSEAHCPVAGLVISGYLADAGSSLDKADDLAMFTNRTWLSKVTGLPVVASLPLCPAQQVRPAKGLIDPAILEAAMLVQWADLMGAA